MPNGGRIHTAFIYLNTEDRKDPKKGRFFAQKFGVLNSLLVAAGLDTSQGVDFEEYLDKDQPLMGQKVLVSFNKNSYIDKSTKEVVPKFEVTGFFPFAQSAE